ncbi:MAG: efflux RND transporter periplasmic adaptor subunit [Paenibacillaceae bacterium]|nr:efflux RND transporter periplasmic adaptor subunit [Paenibacillaceae bacterium]
MFSRWRTASSSPLRRRVALVAVVAALLLASGCSLLPKEGEEEALPTINPPKLSQKPTYIVKTETLETKVRGNGKMMSLQEEELFFKLEGKRLKSVAVQVGDAVQAGQTLAELDVTDLESQLTQKRLQTRKDELAMIQLLRDAGDKTSEEIEQARIDFELKRTEVSDLEDKIAQAKLTAPFAGTIVSVLAKKGDAMQAYSTVAVIADVSKLTVAAAIPTDDVKKIAVGMEAAVDINTAGQVKGKVKQLPVPKDNNNNGDPNNGRPKDSPNDYVLIELDSMPAGLTRGTPLTATVIVSRKENVLTIPPAALRTITGRNYVQVVDDSGAKREVDVEVGQTTSTAVEIVKGLTAGQKVVGR